MTTVARHTDAAREPGTSVRRAGNDLAAGLGPIIPSAMATAAAAGALGLLIYSFGVDVRWLVAGSR